MDVIAASCKRGKYVAHSIEVSVLNADKSGGLLGYSAVT
jgi:hypothetical protein